MTVALLLLASAAFTTGWAHGADRRALTVVHPELETLGVAAIAWIVSRILLMAAVVASVVSVLRVVL